MKNLRFLFIAIVLASCSKENKPVKQPMHFAEKNTQISGYTLFDPKSKKTFSIAFDSQISDATAYSVSPMTGTGGTGAAKVYFALDQADYTVSYGTNQQITGITLHPGKDYYYISADDPYNPKALQGGPITVSCVCSKGNGTCETNWVVDGSKLTASCVPSADCNKCAISISTDSRLITNTSALIFLAEKNRIIGNNGTLIDFDIHNKTTNTFNHVQLREKENWTEVKYTPKEAPVNYVDNLVNLSPGDYTIQQITDSKYTITLQGNTGDSYTILDAGNPQNSMKAGPGTSITVTCNCTMGLNGGSCLASTKQVGELIEISCTADAGCQECKPSVSTSTGTKFFTNMTILKAKAIQLN